MMKMIVDMRQHEAVNVFQVGVDPKFYESSHQSEKLKILNISSILKRNILILFPFQLKYSIHYDSVRLLN